MIEFGGVISVQIFVQAMDEMDAYTEPLPFGLDATMIRSSARQLLGSPTRVDGDTDHFLLNNLGIRTFQF